MCVKYASLFWQCRICKQSWSNCLNCNKVLGIVQWVVMSNRFEENWTRIGKQTWKKTSVVYPMLHNNSYYWIGSKGSLCLLSWDTIDFQLTTACQKVLSFLINSNIYIFTELRSGGNHWAKICSFSMDLLERVIRKETYDLMMKRRGIFCSENFDSGHPVCLTSMW